MSSRAVNVRIVYWGIEGAGKTTNLESIRTRLRADHSGALHHEPTRIDPTVTYEVLPIRLGDVGGRPTQIEIVAVPDGEEQSPTRKQLLDEVSGVVLVIDSQPGCEDANVSARDELARAFESYGRDLAEIPMIVQYNKRDLADDNQIEALHRRIALPSAAAFEAIATDGTGVLQTLTTISKRVVKKIRDQHTPSAAAPTSIQDFAATEVAEKTSAQYDPEALAARARAAVGQDARPRSTTDMLEAAIEADLAESGEAPADSFSRTVPDGLDLDTQATFNASYEELSNEDKPASQLRLGDDLRIVSVGVASRDGVRSVRIPLVLGDASGATASIALTIALDPLLDEPDA